MTKQHENPRRVYRADETPPELAELFAADLERQTEEYKQKRERRREAVYDADHSNALAGLKRQPETDAIFEAFINCEIEANEIAPRLKELHQKELRERCRRRD